MKADVRSSAATEWRAHWKVVLAAMAGVGASTIITYSTALFFEPFERDFGWGRAEIASGHLVASTAAIFLSAYIGLLVDRFGPRRIGLTAVVLMCVAVSLGALLTSNILSWWALWFALAVPVVLIQPTVWTSAVTSLFSAGRGLALAITLCGSGLGSIITPPLTYFLIENYGWRMAFVGLGVAWALLTLPIIFLFFFGSRDFDRRRPAADRQAASNASWTRVLHESMLTRRFLQLLLATFLIAIVIVPIVVTLVPILSSNGLPRGTAAATAALIGVASISGRLTIGVLLDHLPGRFVAAFCVTLPILGSAILLLNPGSTLAATIAVLVYGLALGAELDIVAYLTSRYFKLDNFGTLFGMIGGFITTAAAVGPVILNAVYDQTKSYDLALWGGMPLCALSALLFLFLGPYPRDTQHRVSE